MFEDKKLKKKAETDKEVAAVDDLPVDAEVEDAEAETAEPVENMEEAAAEEPVEEGLTEEEIAAEAEAEAALHVEKGDVLATVSETSPVPFENGEVSEEVRRNSQLSFNEQVIEKIATLALHEVGGVLAATGSGGFFNLKSSKGVEIQFNDHQEVVVNLEVILEYGRSAPEIFAALQKNVTQKIYEMTGLCVKAVNVRVINVLTAEEFNGKS